MENQNKLDVDVMSEEFNFLYDDKNKQDNQNKLNIDIINEECNFLNECKESVMDILGDVQLKDKDKNTAKEVLNKIKILISNQEKIVDDLNKKSKINHLYKLNKK